MGDIRLILGDQLDPKHSWFARHDSSDTYAMMEVRQETDYVRHHAQKVIAIFAAMRDFAETLRGGGHRVLYLRIDDADNKQSIPENLEYLAAQAGATSLELQPPDEYRLDRQFEEFRSRTRLTVRFAANEHFYTERTDADRFFRNRSRWLMEPFYRALRVKHQILVDPNDRPVGGKWNYDSANRKRWRGHPSAPPDRRVTRDQRKLWATISGSGVHTFGDPCADDIPWPRSRADALRHLDEFIEHGLRHFGDYQDAMSAAEPRLFHSLLSFALNTKMLRPSEVIERALDSDAPITAVEGFVRQILGWREYVRGVYWAKMPEYRDRNFFSHALPLPGWFWTGETRMRCLSIAIGDSLAFAYAHHIQRLMVIGNFALLAGLAPAQVHAWYLGVYVDAFEWVELPNTLGMSQYADGGLMASKPYVSSAGYIDKMSDYCASCFYAKSQKTGMRACPFNALYWDFLDRQRPLLQNNPRLALPYRQIDRFTPSSLDDIRARASYLRNHLETL